MSVESSSHEADKLPSYDESDTHAQDATIKPDEVNQRILIEGYAYPYLLEGPKSLEVTMDEVKTRLQVLHEIAHELLAQDILMDIAALETELTGHPENLPNLADTIFSFEISARQFTGPSHYFPAFVNDSFLCSREPKRPREVVTPYGEMVQLFPDFLACLRAYSIQSDEDGILKVYYDKNDFDCARDGDLRHDQACSSATIAALPKVPLDESRLASSCSGSAQCILCAKIIEDATVTMLPTCSHWFHTPCITKFLEAHSRCPFCRIHISTKRHFDLYRPSRHEHDPKYTVPCLSREYLQS